MATVTGITAERVLEMEAQLPESRRLIAFATGFLALDASENVDVEINQTAMAFSIAADSPCRIRAYSTSAQRTADAAREIGVDPEDGTGVLLEVVLTDILLQIKPLSPVAILTNFDVPVAEDIYFAIQNLDPVGGAVTVTLTVMKAE